MMANIRVLLFAAPFLVLADETCAAGSCDEASTQHVQLLQAALHVQGKNTPDNPEVDGGDVDGSHEDVPQDMPWYDKELTPEQLALVPKDLKPVTEEHLGSLALLVANATESSEISPSYDG